MQGTLIQNPSSIRTTRPIAAPSSKVPRQPPPCRRFPVGRKGTPEGSSAIRAEIERRQEEPLSRLQPWIRQPSIAAENRGMNEGCELMMQLLREAGFSGVKKMPTDGQPGVFAI